MDARPLDPQLLFCPSLCVSVSPPLHHLTPVSFSSLHVLCSITVLAATTMRTALTATRQCETRCSARPHAPICMTVKWPLCQVCCILEVSCLRSSQRPSCCTTHWMYSAYLISTTYILFSSFRTSNIHLLSVAGSILRTPCRIRAFADSTSRFGRDLRAV